MPPANETATAGSPKPDGLKTTDPPRQAPPAPASTTKGTVDLELDKVELAGYFKVREQYKDVDDVADTLKGKLGQLAPVLVRPTAGGKYELIAGYRRFAAAKKAGLKTINATVRVLDDHDAHLAALTENLVRRELNPMELAQAIESAIGHGKWLAKDLAKLLGKSEAWVSNHRKLKTLPEPVQAMIAAGELTPGHVEHAIGKTDDPKLQLQIAKKIVKGGEDVREAERTANMEIREAEQEAAWHKRLQASQFRNCPTCKKPAKVPRYVEDLPAGVVSCNENSWQGHKWRLSDGKDPDAEARSARARESARAGAKTRAAAKKEPPKPKYYEPVTFQVPVDDKDLQKGWLRWLSANMTKVTEVDLEDAWGSRTTLVVSLPIKAPAAYHCRDRMGGKFVVGMYGVGSETNDTKRIEARKQLEEFIVKWVPGGAKALPKEGLHGGETVITSCEHCGGGVKGPSRAVIKCHHCKKDTDLGTGRPDGRPVGPAKTLTHPDSFKGRLGNEKVPRKKGYLYYLGKDGYVWEIPTRLNKRGKKSKVGTEKIERRPGFMYYIDRAGYVAVSKLPDSNWSPRKKSKVGGRAKSPASPSEKRRAKKKGRK